MANETVQQMTRGETWKRALFMLLFALIYTVAEVVLVAVVVIQFGFVLITGSRNDKLLHLGALLSKFIYQILAFVTFNTEHKPFPFADWPAVDRDPGQQ